jgi:hypothetical protein
MIADLGYVPRRFVLCVDGGDGAVEAGDVVAWGLEFRRLALVCVCHPSGVQFDLWVFTSVTEARQVLSRYGELRVLWTAESVPVVPPIPRIPRQRTGPADV